MIKKYFFIITTVLSLTLGFTSCEKWIDPALNQHPDQVLSVPLSLLLPGIEANLGFILGGQDVAGVTSTWMQYADGVARQSQVIGGYNIVEGDVANLWSSLYATGMSDIKIMIDQAVASSANHYAGIGQILMALTLGNTTDIFGDVPYAEALLGNDNLSPVYDSQESIYAAIQSLLSSAITYLEGPNTIPVQNDYFLNGNATAWIKVAWSLKARYTLHLSNRKTTWATDVISIVETQNVMTSNSNDLALAFGEGATAQNPIYQFADQRGDVESSPDFAALLNADNDPRIIIFGPLNGDAQYYGGMYYGDKASPVELMTYTELMFIAAEAYHSKGNYAKAAEFLGKGITSSITKYRGLNTGYDATSTAWLASKLATYTGTSTSPSKAEILKQKYIAQFLKTETYVDYRRTGLPNLTPSSAAGIPTRYPYPTGERLYNPNMPNATRYTPVWWDNN